MIWTKITFIFCGKPNCVNRLGVLIKLKQHAFWRVFLCCYFGRGSRSVQFSYFVYLLNCYAETILIWKIVETFWKICGCLAFSFWCRMRSRFYTMHGQGITSIKRTLHSSTTQRLLKQRSRRKKKARAAPEWRPRLAECPRKRRPRGRPPLACLSKEPLACLRSRESPIESPGMGLPHQESVVRIVCYAIKSWNWDWTKGWIRARSR